MRKISFAVLLIPALAWAAPKTADEWYEEGANQYTLGNFEKAIDSFKQGFQLEPDESKKANYLYNIGQAYRQVHDCKNALFFYKRFLALKASDGSKPIPPKKKQQVEGFIAELEVCVHQQNQVSERPPVNNVPPDGEKPDKNPPTGSEGHRETRKEVATTAPGNVAPSDSGEEEDTTSVTATGTSQARLISARFDGGFTRVSAGDIPVPVQPTFALIGGYPLRIDNKLTVEVGAAVRFTPVPVDVTDMAGTKTGTKTSQLWGFLANVAASYEVYPKISVRGDAGAGVLLFADAGNSRFTDNQPTSGALGMFHLRVAASADYAVTPNLVITATPVAFTYSPAKAGLDKSITALTSLDFMVGIGYRK